MDKQEYNSLTDKQLQQAVVKKSKQTSAKPRPTRHKHSKEADKDFRGQRDKEKQHKGKNDEKIRRRRLQGKLSDLQARSFGAEVVA